MNITKYIVVRVVLLPGLVAGGDGTGISTKGDAVAYRAEDLAYDRGDSYTKRERRKATITDALLTVEYHIDCDHLYHRYCTEKPLRRIFPA